MLIILAQLDHCDANKIYWIKYVALQFMDVPTALPL
jgi:hypothetical protein